MNESRYKPDKILVDKESKFYNSSMKSWLQDSDIEKYSTYNKGKSVVTKTFIRTLKEQTLQIYGLNIWKCANCVKLAHIVNKYNNKNHTTLKMNPINVKLITCIDFGVEKDKDLKFNVGDHVRISKYKNTYLQKTTLQIALEKVKNTVQ